MNTSIALNFLFDEKNEQIEPTIDFVVFVSILSITTGFGIFYGCFRIPKDTSEEMHFGKRQMKVCFIYSFDLYFCKSSSDSF